ncbi:Hypothetical protein SRAE_1000236600 [Strongyloides ratti]|uniref:Uncharacterized protein n=1 Tax=Strongyloides ratti TaxID=34506 RepID=A0A090L2S0_STRRB|nr:Hypothetical protein SRAE_1000236600 [Strongyloides ratti]CEF64111.1 Hypothetical protein SRAE_1000236600 [Strongyloides ratti]
MLDIPSSEVKLNNNNDFYKIEFLSKKLHCAMKWSGSQVINVKKFKFWLMRYKKELSLEENDINCIVLEDTPYGWSGITNYCVEQLFFFPYGKQIEKDDVLFYEQFVVLRKVTIFDYKFNSDSCTAAIDKSEAKSIVKIGVDRYNKTFRPEILMIQKIYYSDIF